MRVAPFGIVAAGQPDLAARLAEMDGSVTHAGEGILSGQTVAAAVAQAMLGSPIATVIEAARNVIPVDSWTRRAIDRAVAVASQSPDVWNALAPLNAELVNSSYHWPDIAPEAVALAFGILVASQNDFRAAVLGGVNIGRDADTIAGIVGAIVGAQHGSTAIPAEWARRVSVSQGVCIGVVKGMTIEHTADLLAHVAESWGMQP
jgi:ADP-ribosylglycohydrolase